MSVAARRRSISDDSSRPAMELNAPASSCDSRSPPPVARADRSPAPSRFAAAATSCNGFVCRRATQTDTPAMAATDTRPATSSAALNRRRNGRSTSPAPWTGTVAVMIATSRSATITDALMSCVGVPGGNGGPYRPTGFPSGPSTTTGAFRLRANRVSTRSASPRRPMPPPIRRRSLTASAAASTC